jgi:DNA-binding transcriptional regulator YiaG
MPPHRHQPETRECQNMPTQRWPSTRLSTGSPERDTHHRLVALSTSADLSHIRPIGVRSPPAFAVQIKDLRRRFGGKQWWLAYVAGCSDAAVSFWESGKRIPAPTTLFRIVDALQQAGASPTEVASLQQSWVRAKLLRREVMHRRAGSRNAIHGSSRGTTCRNQTGDPGSNQGRLVSSKFRQRTSTPGLEIT